MWEQEIQWTENKFTRFGSHGDIKDPETTTEWRDAAGQRLRRHSDGWPRFHLKHDGTQQDGGCADTLTDDQDRGCADTPTDDHASTWKRWAHWGLLGWIARRVSRQLHQFWTNDSVSWRPLLLGSATLGPRKISQEGFRNDLCFQKEKSKPIQAEQTPGSSLAPRNKRKPLTSL